MVPCQKWLPDTVAKAPEKPEGILEKADRLLTTLTGEAQNDFCEAIYQWGKMELPTSWEEI